MSASNDKLNITRRLSKTDMTRFNLSRIKDDFLSEIQSALLLQRRKKGHDST